MTQLNMDNQKLSLALAKVMIAAAWADGEIQPEELQYLKQFVRDHLGMDENVWSQLNAYESIPVEDDERKELIEDLHRHIHTQEDKKVVIDAIEKIFLADSIFTHEEKSTIEEIKTYLGIDIN